MALIKKESPNWISIFMAISIFMNVASLYLLMGYSISLWWVSWQTGPNAIGIRSAVMDALLDLEYAKAWGKENYNLIQTAQRYSFQDQVPQIKQYIEARNKQWTGITTSGNEVAPTVTSSLSQDEIKALKTDAVIEGNKDAPISLIEYSDMECPFCIRQATEEKPIEKVRQKYGDKVNSMFKHSRWVNHPGTQTKALAVLCAKQAWTDDMYVKMYNGIYAQSTLQSVMDVSKLADLAKKIGLDVKKWQNCIDTKSTLSLFESQTKEALKFNLNWTPGTLVLNNKTGKYKTIEWAYPTSQFESAVEELLK